MVQVEEEMIERFFASRGFYTRKLNPPSNKYERKNKSIVNVTFRVSFGWGQEPGIGVERNDLMIRVPLFGYQLNVRLHLGDSVITGDYVNETDTP
jgi:hypothetical protein